MGREFFDGLVDEIVMRVVTELREPQQEAEPDRGGWLDSRAAAEYAGCSVHSLRKAIAARELEIRQESKGGKVWIRRAWIDAWRGL